jgi:hypothetical protein
VDATVPPQSEVRPPHRPGDDHTAWLAVHPDHFGERRAAVVGADVEGVPLFRIALEVGQVQPAAGVGGDLGVDSTIGDTECSHVAIFARGGRRDGEEDSRKQHQHPQIRPLSRARA